MKRGIAIAVLAGLGIVGFIATLDPDASWSANDTSNHGDIAWMLTATGLVMLMTPGLSFFYGGMVHRKNVISTMLQSFIALCIVSLLWVTIGFTLAFGDSIGGVIGDPRTFFMMRGVSSLPSAALSPTIPLLLFALFQLKFAVITPALVTGAFAERVRFSSQVVFTAAFAVFIYSPLAHWTWHPDGFLHKWGVLDFAGGTVVHISAGIAALVGAQFLGRRKVHVLREQHAPANIPFVILGTGMLWFGWFGFNAGSALEANGTAVKAVLTTNTASAAAAMSWLLIDYIRGKKPSALGACIGAVVGLVAITPGAGYVDMGASIVIGAVAALVSNVVVTAKNKTGIDDTLDVFPCHGVGGIVGTILTAVFALQGGLIHGDAHLLLVHLAAVSIVCVFVAVGSFLLYRIINVFLPFRVSPEQEELGLDRSQHDETLDAEAVAATL